MVAPSGKPSCKFSCKSQPALNTTIYNGSVGGVQGRQNNHTTLSPEKIELKGSDHLKQCAAKLTSVEFLDLQSLLVTR